MLVVFGIAAFGFAVASAFLIDRWFNKENYRPEPYYRYFYRKGGNFNEPSSKKNLKIVEDQFFSKHFSPSNVTLASELFLLLAAIWIVFELPVPLL